MDITIRQAEPEDIDRVLSVLLDGKRAIARLGIAQWQTDDYPNRAIVEADVAVGSCYVAEPAPQGVSENGADSSADPKTILGTVSLIDTGEPTYDAIDGAWLTDSDSVNPSYSCLHRCAVACAASRCGVMSSLFSRSEQISRSLGFGSIRVDTHPGNIRMRAFLEKHGYTYCGVITLDTDEVEPGRVAYEKVLS